MNDTTQIKRYAVEVCVLIFLAWAMCPCNG